MRKTVLLSILIAAAVLLVALPSIIYSLNPNKTACISITFDDGYKSHYTTAMPLLKEKGFNATFFVYADAYKGNEPLFMNESDIKELILNGYEIGSHTITHPYLGKISKENAEEELKMSKYFLERDFGIQIVSLALPYTSFNLNVLNTGRFYYTNIRSLYSTNFFFINTYSFKKGQTAEDACTKISDAKKHNLWLILVFHNISDKSGSWGITPSDFSKILDCAEKSNITISSLNGCSTKLATFR